MPCWAMDEHRGVWPIRTMCRVMGVSASGYYAWRPRPESRRSCEDRTLSTEIRHIHAESGGVYGAPRLHAVLRTLGRSIGRNRVARLMRAGGLRGLAALPRRMRTTDSRHSYPIAPNRIGRNFTAMAPNQVWLTDWTCIPTGEGRLYLAALIDMHTRKVVGWAMRETLHAAVHRARTDGATMNDRRRSAAHSHRAAAPAPGPHPTLGSRRPIRTRRVSPSPCRRRHYAPDEPARQLPRQRADGELLPHTQGRARSPSYLRHTRRGTKGLRSDTSRPSTTRGASIRPSATDHRPTSSEWRPNRVRRTGGRSEDPYPIPLESGGDGIAIAVPVDWLTSSDASPPGHICRGSGRP